MTTFARKEQKRKANENMDRSYEKVIHKLEGEVLSSKHLMKLRKIERVFDI